ncbi:homoaconitase large subunit [Paradesulfitobacterium aromaticivorans]
MGSTLAEKILAKASGKQAVSPGEIVQADIDLAMMHDTTGPQAVAALTEIGAPGVWDRTKVIVILDHLVPAPHSNAAQLQRTMRDFAKREQISNYYDINAGVCHQVLVEKGHVQPGQIIVGTDSHTCTAGAMGAFAMGIGSTEMAAVLATGKLWFRVPATIKVEVTGELPPIVSAKDLILEIIGRLGVEGANYKAVEFTGSTISKLSIGERMTLCNMVIEMGGKAGMVAADSVTLNYLAERGITLVSTLIPDEDANYESVLKIEAVELRPVIAHPFSVDYVHPINHEEKIKINQALLGTCTNGRLSDLHEAAALMRGKRINSGVRLLVVPASWEVYRAAMLDGTLDVFIQAGAIIVNPGCGPCCGGHEGLIAPGEVCISTSNRNFVGRMGKDGKVYLASPAVVAASALTGEITDPRELLVKVI